MDDALEGYMRLFVVVLLAPLGCGRVAADNVLPVGDYSGPITAEDATVLVTGVDDACLTVAFSDCAGELCADVLLTGTIETALGDISEGSMPVEELVLKGEHVTGELAYNDSRYKVKGDFSDDRVSLKVKICAIAHATLDFVDED